MLLLLCRSSSCPSLHFDLSHFGDIYTNSFVMVSSLFTNVLLYYAQSAVNRTSSFRDSIVKSLSAARRSFVFCPAADNSLYCLLQECGRVFPMTRNCVINEFFIFHHLHFVLCPIIRYIPKYTLHILDVTTSRIIFHRHSYSKLFIQLPHSPELVSNVPVRHIKFAD